MADESGPSLHFGSDALEGEVAREAARLVFDNDVNEVSGEWLKLQILIPFVPRVLLRHVSDSEAPIAVEAAILLVDISGFSKLSDHYASLGSEGIEKFTMAIQSYFTTILDVVFKYGGDVMCFAGDAILIVFWPEELRRDESFCARLAVECAWELHQKHSPYETEGIQLTLHSSAALGDISLVNAGDGTYKSCFLIGEAMGQLQIAQNQSMREELVVSAEAWVHLSDICKGREKGNGCVLIESVTTPLTAEQFPRVVSSISGVMSTTKLVDVIGKYVPDVLFNRVHGGDTDWLAERRKVTVGFAVFDFASTNSPRVFSPSVTTATWGEDMPGMFYHDETSTERVSRVVQAAVGIVNALGGMIRQVTTDDKGMVLIYVFGVHGHSQTDRQIRALRVGLKLQKELEKLCDLKVNVGVSTGNAYCGPVGNLSKRCEYAVVGHTVNLAARLAMLKKGVLCCQSMYESILSKRDATSKMEFSICANFFDKVLLKGHVSPVSVYKATRRNPTRDKFETDAKTDIYKIIKDYRAWDLERLKEFVRKIPSGETHGGCVVVESDIGMGAIVLREAISNNALGDENFCHLIESTDLEKSSFPFVAKKLAVFLESCTAPRSSFLPKREPLMPLDVPTTPLPTSRSKKFWGSPDPDDKALPSSDRKENPLFWFPPPSPALEVHLVPTKRGATTPNMSFVLDLDAPLAAQFHFNSEDSESSSFSDIVEAKYPHPILVSRQEQFKKQKSLEMFPYIGDDTSDFPQSPRFKPLSPGANLIGSPTDSWPDENLRLGSAWPDSPQMIDEKKKFSGEMIVISLDLDQTSQQPSSDTKSEMSLVSPTVIRHQSGTKRSLIFDLGDDTPAAVSHEPWSFVPDSSPSDLSDTFELPPPARESENMDLAIRMSDFSNSPSSPVHRSPAQMVVVRLELADDASESGLMSQSSKEAPVVTAPNFTDGEDILFEPREVELTGVFDMVPRSDASGSHPLSLISDPMESHAGESAAREGSGSGGDDNDSEPVDPGPHAAGQEEESAADARPDPQGTTEPSDGIWEARQEWRVENGQQLKITRFFFIESSSETSSEREGEAAPAVSLFLPDGSAEDATMISKSTGSGGSGANTQTTRARKTVLKLGDLRTLEPTPVESAAREEEEGERSTSQYSDVTPTVLPTFEDIRASGGNETECSGITPTILSRHEDTASQSSDLTPTIVSFVEHKDGGGGSNESEFSAITPTLLPLQLQNQSSNESLLLAPTQLTESSGSSLNSMHLDLPLILPRAPGDSIESLPEEMSPTILHRRFGWKRPARGHGEEQHSVDSESVTSRASEYFQPLNTKVLDWGPDSESLPSADIPVLESVDAEESPPSLAINAPCLIIGPSVGSPDGTITLSDGCRVSVSDSSYSNADPAANVIEIDLDDGVGVAHDGESCEMGSDIAEDKRPNIFYIEADGRITAKRRVPKGPVADLRMELLPTRAGGASSSNFVVDCSGDFDLDEKRGNYFWTSAPEIVLSDSESVLSDGRQFADLILPPVEKRKAEADVTGVMVVVAPSISEARGQEASTDSSGGQKVGSDSSSLTDCRIDLRDAMSSSEPSGSGGSGECDGIANSVKESPKLLPEVLEMETDFTPSTDEAAETGPPALIVFPVPTLELAASPPPIPSPVRTPSRLRLMLDIPRVVDTSSMTEIVFATSLDRHAGGVGMVSVGAAVETVADVSVIATPGASEFLSGKSCGDDSDRSDASVRSSPFVMFPRRVRDVSAQQTPGGGGVRSVSSGDTPISDTTPLSAASSHDWDAGRERQRKKRRKSIDIFLRTPPEASSAHNNWLTACRLKLTNLFSQACEAKRREGKCVTLILGDLTALDEITAMVLAEAVERNFLKIIAFVRNVHVIEGLSAHHQTLIRLAAERVLRLRPLDAPNSARLVSALYKPERVRVSHRLGLVFGFITAGNPRFLEHYFALAVELGLIYTEEIEGDRLFKIVKFDEHQLLNLEPPETIAQLVTAAIDSLTPALSLSLRICATLSAPNSILAGFKQRFSFADVCGSYPQEDSVSDIEGYLDQLVAYTLLERRDVKGMSYFNFTSEVVRKVAHALLLASQIKKIENRRNSSVGESSPHRVRSESRTSSTSPSDLRFIENFTPIDHQLRSLGAREEAVGMSIGTAFRLGKD